MIWAVFLAQWAVNIALMHLLAEARGLFEREGPRSSAYLAGSDWRR